MYFLQQLLMSFQTNVTLLEYVMLWHHTDDIISKWK